MKKNYGLLALIFVMWTGLTFAQTYDIDYIFCDDSEISCSAPVNLTSSTSNADLYFLQEPLSKMEESALMPEVVYVSETGEKFPTYYAFVSDAGNSVVPSSPSQSIYKLKNIIDALQDKSARFVYPILYPSSNDAHRVNVFFTSKINHVAISDFVYSQKRFYRPIELDFIEKKGSYDNDTPESLYLTSKMKISVEDGYQLTSSLDVRFAASFSEGVTGLNRKFSQSPIATSETMGVNEAVTLLDGFSFGDPKDGYVTVEVGQDGSIDLSNLINQLFSALYGNEDQAGALQLGLQIGADVKPIEYKINFVENTSSNVFCPSNSDCSEKTSTYTVDGNNQDFPTLASVDEKCFIGWNFDKDAKDGFENFSSVGFLQAISAQNPDNNGEYTLYAVWNDRDKQGAQCKSRTLKADVFGDGELYLTQNIFGEPVLHKFEKGSDGHSATLDVPDGEYIFIIDPEPSSGYEATGLKRIEVVNGGDPDFYSMQKDDDVTYSSEDEGFELSFRVVFINTSSYTLNFGLADVLQDHSQMVFATYDGSFTLDSIMNVDREIFLPYLYDNEKEQIGSSWSLMNIDAFYGQYDVMENGNEFRKLDVNLAIYREETGVNKMEPKWEDANLNEGGTFAITSGIEHAKLTLVQKINGKDVEHEIGSIGLVLPVPDESMSYGFKIKLEVEKGYGLLGKVEMAKRGENPQFYDSDEIVKLSGKSKENNEVKFSATIKPETVLSFEINTSQKGVMYGEDWVESSKFVYDENSKENVEIPKFVYTEDSCVLGWAVEPNAKSPDLLANELFQLSTGNYYMAQESFFRAVLEGAQTPNQSYDLHAVWGPADECLEYTRVNLEKTEGTVSLVEVANNDPISHTLKSDGSSIIFLPFSAKEMRVHVTPNTGYVLDSLVFFSERYFEEYDEFAKDSANMSDDDKKNWKTHLEEFHQTYKEGDLVGYLGTGTFRAYFRKDGGKGGEPDPEKMQFAGKTLLQSGNAIELILATSAEGSRPAVVKASLIDVLGVVVASHEQNVTASDTMEWSEYPLNPGNYLVTAVLEVDGEITDYYEQDFEVKDVVAESCEDCWQMVALNKADLQNLDADDALVYWWDESKNFGYFWQYQELSLEDEPELGRGYWYNSMKGTPLSLKAEKAFAGNVEWLLESVYSGWNQVANPYGWYVDIYEGETRDKSSFKFLRWSDTEGYTEVQILKPYEAVWVKTTKRESWKLSGKPAFVTKVNEDGEAVPMDLNGSNSLKKLAKADNSREWSIQAVLADKSGKRDSWNVMGVRETELVSEEPPAGMGNFVNLSIVEGKASLMESFKRASKEDSYEWTVELSATSNRKGYLSFAGLRSLQALGLKVFVTVDGETTEMSEGSSLEVPLAKKAKTAVVRVAPASKVVAKAELGNLRAYGVGSALNVQFSASAGLAGANARVELFDMKGHRVVSSEFKAASGSNSAQLSAPERGLYMVRVSVGSVVQTARIVVK